MKKIILVSIAVVAIAVSVVFNVSLNKRVNRLSTISLANMEALADNGEGDDDSKKHSTTKKVTKYFYDSNNRLERTEEHDEPCCTTGGASCSSSPC
jgi:hypothetical protein